MCKFFTNTSLSSSLSTAGQLTAPRGLSGVLCGYGDKYIVTDLRKRSKKEPGEVKSLSTKNLEIKLSEKAPRNYRPDITSDTKGYKKIYFWHDSDNEPIKLEIDYKSKKTSRWGAYYPVVKPDFSKLYNWQEVSYSGKNYSAIIESEYYYKLVSEWCLDYFKHLLTTDKIRDNERRKELCKNFISDGIPDTYADAETAAKIKDLYKKKFYKRFQEKENGEGLGKPTIKFEFETNDELKKFLSENKENLIESYIDVTPEGEEVNENRGKLLGAHLPAEFFNVPTSELVTYGMKTTYKKLADYSSFFAPAAKNEILRGYGFDDTTLNLLQRIVIRDWRSVQKLADHLKADTQKQSAFNVWYWLHENIKYNYDAAGREEIRTPARSWADRKNGIDCDCLAVLTYCIFLCMGYRPKFEIIAFDNSKKFSHIFVNLDGLAVDRVLPVFGVRPLKITNTLIMEIPVYELNGISLSGLRGVYENALRKVNNKTATAADKLEMQKSKILIQLAGAGDINGYRLGALIMPHVVGIDDKGAYYFSNAEIARIAKEGENSILQAERRGASEAELNGLFKKIGNAFKKVATATAKVVAAPVKATVNATKATVNVVKAGVQAVTGNTAAAKESLQTAGSQIKASVVDPVKTSVDATKTIVKETIVNPVKTTITVAGKVFKVIFIKINPITVLMRNALRALIAINFLGMATRLNVANYSVGEAAIAAGYTREQYEDAKKAKKKVVNFFTKMGGKAENIEKTIQKGAGRKALFKKDYNKDTKITITDDDATLGEAGTIGACLAAVGAFFVKIWNWVKNIVPKVVSFVKDNKETIQTVASMLPTQKDDGSSEAGETEIATETSVELNTSSTEESSNTGLMIGGAVALAAVALLASGKKKKGKKKKK